MFKVEGVITALITPLDKDGKLCAECLEHMIEFQYKKGIQALFLTGTYGEGIILPEKVRVDIYRYALEYSKSNMILLPHVGAADVETVLRLVKAAKDLGYKAVSVVGPIYHKPTRRGLIEFYSYIAKADVEIVVYNNKGRQGYNISPDDFEALVREVPAVVGIKDTSYDPEQLLEYVKRFGGKYFIGGAGDSLIAYNFLIGADAHICGLSNAFPELAVAIYRAVTEGDVKKAFELQYRLNKVRKIIRKFGVESPEVLREILKLRGVDAGYPPIQLAEAIDERQKEELKKLVEPILKELVV